MPSEREKFWEHTSYAVIGNSAKMPFPRLTYGGLKRAGKTVYAIDPTADAVDGDKAFASLSALPQKVQAAVLELPNEETASWVKKATEAGIKNIWLHMDTETPEALELARKSGAHVLTGTCAVMYVSPNSFPHNIHKWIAKLAKTY